MTGRAFLLDTNVLLAATIAPHRLRPEVQQWLSDRRNQVFFSSASLWEIGIKRSLDRDHFTFYPEDIHQLALDTGFTELPVSGGHTYPIARMPWHHRDPFDRLLVAQAQSIPARLLTTDRLLSIYSDLVLQVQLLT